VTSGAASLGRFRPLQRKLLAPVLAVGLMATLVIGYGTYRAVAARLEAQVALRGNTIVDAVVSAVGVVDQRPVLQRVVAAGGGGRAARAPPRRRT
jgi:hypothetical protein